MSLLALVIGWIIVLTFGATSFLTLLSFTGLIPIEEPYKRILFEKLILEIITAALFFFFLYTSGLKNVSYTPKEIYPFGFDGKPVNFKIYQGETLLKEFDELPNFKSIEREAEVKNNKLYFTTREQVYLGYLGNLREKLAQRLLTCEMALGLGLYLSQFEDGNRRNPHQAVEYLLYALKAGEEHRHREREEAVKRLHFLLDHIKESDDFKLLLRMIDKYRTDHNKHFELAEAYLYYARKTHKNAQEKSKASLKYYLLFLSSPASEMKDLEKTKNAAASRIKELLEFDLANDKETQAKGKIILRDIRDHNRPALRAHSEDIPKSDLSQLD